MQTTNIARYDRARFYKVPESFPSVTTALDAINKPALGPWYAKEERRHFETALLDVAAKYPTITSDQLVDVVIKTVNGTKAADREKTKAAAIGTAAHAGVEWHTRKLMGEDPGPEPEMPDAAVWAVEAWKDWAKSVEFRPLAVERTVFCRICGYAGTLDWLAYVKDVRTVGDIKTGKRIYPEAFLQNIAYRHAGAQQGLESDAGLILRLPKTVDDPAFEAMPVPETPLADFLAVLSVWRWVRRMDGLPVGDPPTGHGH